MWLRGGGVVAEAWNVVWPSERVLMLPDKGSTNGNSIIMYVNAFTLITVLSRNENLNPIARFIINFTLSASLYPNDPAEEKELVKSDFFR